MPTRSSKSKTLLIVLMCFAAGTIALIIVLLGADRSHPPGTVPTSAVGVVTLPASLPANTEPKELLKPTQFVEERVTGGIGVGIRLRDGEPFVDGLMTGSPAETGGIIFGDVITHVDGVPTHGLPLNDVKRHLGGIVGTSVILDVRRAGRSAGKFTITRKAWRELKASDVKVPGARLEFDPSLLKDE